MEIGKHKEQYNLIVGKRVPRDPSLYNIRKLVDDNIMTLFYQDETYHMIEKML